MQESLNGSIFISLCRKLAYWFGFSILGRITGRVAGFAAGVLKGSRVVKVIFGDWNENEAWSGSLLHRLAAFPVWLLKVIHMRFGASINRSIDSSFVMSSLKGIFSNMEFAGTRFIGLVILAYTAAEGTLWAVFEVNEVKPLLMRLGIGFIALVLIILNVNLKPLFEGSLLAKTAAGFFKGRVND